MLIIIMLTIQKYSFTLLKKIKNLKNRSCESTATRMYVRIYALNAYTTFINFLGQS